MVVDPAERGVLRLTTACTGAFPAQRRAPEAIPRLSDLRAQARTHAGSGSWFSCCRKKRNVSRSTPGVWLSKSLPDASTTRRLIARHSPPSARPQCAPPSWRARRPITGSVVCVLPEPRALRAVMLLAIVRPRRGDGADLVGMTPESLPDSPRFPSCVAHRVCVVFVRFRSSL